MAGTIRVDVGLHFGAEAQNQQSYIPAEVVFNQPMLKIADSSYGDQEVWHRFDMWYPNTAWDHSNFFIPANLFNTGSAPVTVRYLYSDDLFDITTDDGRGKVLARLNSTPLSQAAMRLVGASYGQYRYLLFTLGTNGGTEYSSLMEAGFIEEAVAKPFIGHRLEISIEDPSLSAYQFNHIAGESVSLQIKVRSVSKGTYDLSGVGSAYFALHRTRDAAALSSPLVGPKAITIDDDPTTGLATVTLTATETKSLRGNLVGEVSFVEGTRVYKSQFYIRFVGPIYNV